MKCKLFLLVMTLFPLFTSGQIFTGGESGHDKVESSKITPWITNDCGQYQGIYHFGFSDGESDFILIIVGDSCYAQIRSGEWTKRDGKEQWLRHYNNIHNVRIQGNKFFSNETNGDFIIYDWGTKKTKGLVVSNPWNKWFKTGESEFGFFYNTVDNYLSGKYDYASWRLLSEDELQKLSAQDLKIMRNEIFARYGYMFNPGGDMDSYFSLQKKWYGRYYENVNDFLTGLENRNIKLIETIEKNKKDL